MNTQEKIDAGFDVRKIPETKPRKVESNDQKENKKRNYGNKYLQNRRSISIEDKIAERLNSIQEKRQIKTKGELFTYLANLEEAIDPKMETFYTCKTCHKKVDVPKNIKIDRFVHNDLCETESCKGYITSKTDIAYDSKGFVISNKDKANGTTTKSDKNRVQTDTNKRKETNKEMYKRLEENTKRLFPDKKLETSVNFSEADEQSTL